MLANLRLLEKRFEKIIEKENGTVTYQERTAVEFYNEKGNHYAGYDGKGFFLDGEYLDEFYFYD